MDLRNRIAETQRAGGATVANLQRGTYGTQGEVKDWSYYDTAKLSVGSNVYNYFTVATGQQGKTLADTNLNSAGSIPQGQNFTINDIKMFITADNLYSEVDVIEFYKWLCTTTLSVEVSGKSPLLQVNLNELMGINSSMLLVPSVPGDNVGGVSLPIPRKQYELKIPIVLGGTTTFKVVLTSSEGIHDQLTDLKVQISLHGVLASLS